MSEIKQERASESAMASEQEAGVLAHLPASFRVLAEFALKEGDENARRTSPQ